LDKLHDFSDATTTTTTTTMTTTTTTMMMMTMMMTMMMMMMTSYFTPHIRRWISRARARLTKKEKIVKGTGFRGKRSMDMFEVHACSMNYVSVSQVTCDV
jgi:hypothetical protein